MPKRESTSKKSAPRRGTLASYRRENAHIQRMVLANLTPEQRMQLSTTRGNPHIEARVSRFITALDRADRVLHSLPKNRRNPRGLMTERNIMNMKTTTTNGNNHGSTTSNPYEIPEQPLSERIHTLGMMAATIFATRHKHHSSGLDSPGHYDAVKEAVLIASDLMERIEDQEWERAVQLAKAEPRRSGREVQE